MFLNMKMFIAFILTMHTHTHIHTRTQQTNSNFHVSYQELIHIETKLVEHNADMSMVVEPVKHTDAVTTEKTQIQINCNTVKVLKDALQKA